MCYRYFDIKENLFDLIWFDLNKTYHRTICMPPNKVTKGKETNLWWKMYWPIDGDIKLLYIFHFSLFWYYTISFLIIYYLIIIKVIVWLRSKLLSLADSPGHKMFIYRHVITSKFTLWWSDKLKHESNK